VHLLQELKPFLDANGLEVAVVGIATRSRGAVFEHTGLDAVRVAQRVAGGDMVAPLSTSPTAHSLIAQLGSLSAEVRVMVETTTLEVQFAETAISHVRAALSAGAHVISANKGPVAHAYRELSAAARAAGRQFLFEVAVMDGIPIFNLVRETMPGVVIQGFRGVVNSTTNHILTAMERGEPFAGALARMDNPSRSEARKFSGTEKSSLMTLVSSSVVITSPGLMRVPTLTRRKPTRPENGARITVSSSRAVAAPSRARFALSVASSCSKLDLDKACVSRSSRRISASPPVPLHARLR
jgi:hypothetical protein